MTLTPPSHFEKVVATTRWRSASTSLLSTAAKLLTWHWACSSKVVNQSLWKYASLSKEACASLIRGSFTCMSLDVENFKWHPASNLQTWRRHHAIAWRASLFDRWTPQVCPNNGCYKPYSWRNDHHSLSWNEAFGNSYPQPKTIISVTSRCEVPIYSDIHLQFCSLAHNWLAVYLPLWKICSSVGKMIQMFQTTNQIMNYHSPSLTIVGP